MLKIVQTMSRFFSATATTRRLKLGLVNTPFGSSVMVCLIHQLTSASSNLTFLCSDNERGSVYIHETTPYARRDDIEIAPRECKTHKATSDKHKSFQVCNRMFHFSK
jgi:hypothetical protein